MRSTRQPLDCEECHDWYLRSDEKLKDVCGGTLVGLMANTSANHGDVTKH